MSPTTLRPGARALGALLVSAALVGVPSLAQADETPAATPSPSASASLEPSATATTSPSPSASVDPSAPATGGIPSAPAPTTTAPSPTTSAPSPTTSAPAPTAEPRPDAALVPGGESRRYGVAAAAGPTTSTDPVLVGANYLEEQLRAGGHLFSVDFGGTLYPDYGVTADAVLALDAAGTGQAEATLATKVLADNVVNYIGFGDPTEVYAGSLAKLLNVAVAQEVDPTAFGGFDLVATLEGLEQPNGRFTDRTIYGDSSNTFGQSFAIIGLHRAGEPVSAEAVAYLLDQQCPNGAFKLYESDGGCTTNDDADPDATAMAVQALLAVGGHAAAANDGLDYLVSRQAANGGVGGGGPQVAVNANSTGLAGQAFLAGGRTAQARLAQSYLVALQYDCGFPAALRGGIAYDQTAYDTQEAAGATAVPNDQDRRSTSQALLALAGVPLGSVTATGADAEAPALGCASASPTATATPTATPSTTVEPTATDGATPTAGAGSTAEPTAVAAAPSGSLAQTGSDPLLPVLVGLALVVLGALAVVASRRRGAHA